MSDKNVVVVYKIWNHLQSIAKTQIEFYTVKSWWCDRLLSKYYPPYLTYTTFFYLNITHHTWPIWPFLCKYYPPYLTYTTFFYLNITHHTWPIWPFLCKYYPPYLTDMTLFYLNIIAILHLYDLLLSKYWGHSGRVVTLSPPTSEARVRFPAWLLVGKLVVACRWWTV